MTTNIDYTRQKKYLSSALQKFKRITLLVPKNDAQKIKDIAKKMRESLSEPV